MAVLSILSRKTLYLLLLYYLKIKRSKSIKKVCGSENYLEKEKQKKHSIYL